MAPTNHNHALAETAWVAMRAFVEGNAHPPNLRERLDLGRGSGRIMVLLQLQEGPRTLREIAQAQGVDAPYATIIVDKLQTLGLVARTPHPDDRRRKLVALTAAGREAAQTAREMRNEPPPGLQALSGAQLQALAELLSHLV